LSEPWSVVYYVRIYGMGEWDKGTNYLVGAPIPYTGVEPVKTATPSCI